MPAGAHGRPRVGPRKTQNSRPTGRAARSSSHGCSCDHATVHSDLSALIVLAVAHEQRDAAGAVLFGHCASDLGAKPLGVEFLCGQPRAGVGDFDAASDFQLISPERYDADRHACSERFLCGAGATVGDRADRVGEQRCVREEALNPSVGRHATAELGGRHRRHHVYVFVGECVERGPDEATVVLKLRRGGHENERTGDLM